MKLIKGEKYSIEWFDAFGEGFWDDEKGVKKTLEAKIEIETLGFFVMENERYIAIAQVRSYLNTQMPFLRVEYIPKGCVKSIKKLK